MTPPNRGKSTSEKPGKPTLPRGWQEISTPVSSLRGAFRSNSQRIRQEWPDNTSAVIDVGATYFAAKSTVHAKNRGNPRDRPRLPRFPLFARFFGALNRAAAPPSASLPRDSVSPFLRLQCSRFPATNPFTSVSCRLWLPAESCSTRSWSRLYPGLASSVSCPRNARQSVRNRSTRRAARRRPPCRAIPSSTGIARARTARIRRRFRSTSPCLRSNSSSASKSRITAETARIRGPRGNRPERAGTGRGKPGKR